MTAAPARTVAAVLLLAWTAAVCGCATVTVNTEQGTIRARGLFGVQVLPYSLSPIAVHSRGLGAFAGAGEFSLGLQSRVAVYAPDPNSCRVVLIGQRAEETQRLIETLQRGGIEASDICTDTGGIKR
jgi:hypothetical protein